MHKDIINRRDVTNINVRYACSNLTNADKGP